MTQIPNTKIVNENPSTTSTGTHGNRESDHYDALPLQPVEVEEAPVFAPVSSNMSPAPPATSFSAFQRKNNLPAFLNKLYDMVSAPDSDYWVHWSSAGDSFIIPDSQALADQVLGRHFKHRNFPSFVRQLNMYGFHKVPHLNHGVLHNDGQPEIWEFTNENFRRDDPAMMRFIKRKKGVAEKARAAKHPEGDEVFSSVAPWCPDTADLAIARAEIHSVAQRQQEIRNEVERIATSYEGLYKYAMETRRRSDDQQNKLNRLIKYLSVRLPRRGAVEFPNRVRGLLEGPSGPLVEELSDRASPAAPANVESSQLELMRMIASGKIPPRVREAFELCLRTNATNTAAPVPLVAASPTSPACESPEAVGTSQVTDSVRQLAKVQDWIDNTDNTIAGLRVAIDPTSANTDYSNYYLNDPTFSFDYTGGVDPSTTDIFAADPTMVDANLQQWVANYYNSGNQDTIVSAGQKRPMEDDLQGASLSKKLKE